MCGRYLFPGACLLLAGYAGLSLAEPQKARDEVWVGKRVVLAKRVVDIFDKPDGVQITGKLKISLIDTGRKKDASCGRLESARHFAFSSIVSLAKPFSSCFLRCLVHVSLSSPWPRLSQAVSLPV